MENTTSIIVLLNNLYTEPYCTVLTTNLMESLNNVEWAKIGIRCNERKAKTEEQDKKRESLGENANLERERRRAFSFPKCVWWNEWLLYSLWLGVVGGLVYRISLSNVLFNGARNFYINTVLLNQSSLRIEVNNFGDSLDAHESFSVRATLRTRNRINTPFNNRPPVCG